MTSTQRRAAYDAATKFTQLQQQLASQPESASTAIANYSRDVSSVLSAGAGGDNSTDSNPDAALLSQERALWELISLFFVDASSAEGFIPQDMSRWLKSNTTAIAGSNSTAPLPSSLLQQLQEAALPEANPLYWQSLHRLVALGWASEAIELLGLHSAWLRWDGAASSSEPEIQAQVAALEAVTLLMRRFPSLEGHGGAGATGRQFGTVQEFTTYRKAWQTQCKTLLQNEEVWAACANASRATAQALQVAVQLLAGDTASLAAATHNWVELLVGYIVHLYPIASRAETRHLLRDCANAKTSTTNTEFLLVLARVVDACCDADAQTALQACSEMCSDWFLAHVPDVFSASMAGRSALGAELPHLGGTQTEFYLLDYAMAMAPHANTWKVAAAYLAWCSVHGQVAFERMIHQLPLNDATFNDVLEAGSLCDEYGLTELKKDLYSIQGVLCFEKGLLAAALTWLSHAEDISRIDAVLGPLVAQLLQGNALTDATREMIAQHQLSSYATKAQPEGGSNTNINTVAVYENLYGDAHQSSGLHAALGALSALPPDVRNTCRQLVDNYLKSSGLQNGEQDIMMMLEWLQDQQQPTSDSSLTRLHLLKLLAATYIRSG